MMSNLDVLKDLGADPQPLGIFQPEHPELPGSESVRTYNNEGVTGEGKLWQPYRDKAQELGIEILYETPGKELIQNPATGEIIGVKAENAGKTINIKAKKAVILGCGSFEYDFETQKQFLPGWPVYGWGTPFNTGDGMKMAQKVGAAIWHMNNALASTGAMIVKDITPDFPELPVPMSYGTQSYIWVNKQGKRFMNENRESRHGFGHKEYTLVFDGVLGDFEQLPCWVVMDEACLKKSPLCSMSGRKFGWFNWYSDYTWSKDNSAEVEKGWILKADNVADLAKQMEVDPDALAATLTAYNEAAAADTNKDPAFGRPDKNVIPLASGTLYAVKLYPHMYNTQGGPRRNANCQIIDPMGNPIPRLYSAGELGSFWGWMYNGGGNNSEAMATGRIAARNAVAETEWA